MDTPALAPGLPDRLAAIRARIASATSRSGRPPEAVRLVAVSKTFDADAVREAHAAGQLDFGENRVQEALAKRAALADLPLRWHLIGHLQTNKASKVPGAFACVHSVDGEDVLLRLSRAADAGGHVLPILVQVDLASEATKSGAPESSLRTLLARAGELPGLQVEGLMLLPPFAEDPEDVRPWFRRLRALRDTLVAEGVPAAHLRELSMGMSHDFEVAIEEGATIVRVGSAIFGSRG